MDGLWLLPPAVLIAGAPVVAAALVGAIREATLAQRSLTAFSHSVREEGRQLGTKARTLGRTARQLRADRFA